MTIYNFLRIQICCFLLMGCSFLTVKAQDSIPREDSIEISILTCGTGTSEVYQAYGHTGIRVHNFTQNTDIVYNYGMFSFGDNFMSEFIRGKLLYFVATQDFNNFMRDYVEYGRSVREQVLNLNAGQKKKLVLALENNILPENRYYLYDFIYNNCSTQPRDLIRRSIGEDFKFKTLATENTETVRELVDKHMVYNEWLDFGIDLLLGVRFDKVANADTRMFLPAELMTEFDSTEYHGAPIVKDSSIIFHGHEQAIPNIPGPTVVFWILLVMLLLLQIFVKNPLILRISSLKILTITGIVGWILVFMWFGTDHYMTKWNYNLLWAMPVYFPFAFFFYKAKTSAFWRYLIQICRLILILLLVGWCWNPQQYHSAVIPIILLILWALGVFLPIPVTRKK